MLKIAICVRVSLFKAITQQHPDLLQFFSAQPLQPLAIKKNQTSPRRSLKPKPSTGQRQVSSGPRLAAHSFILLGTGRFEDSEHKLRCVCVCVTKVLHLYTGRVRRSL